MRAIFALVVSESGLLTATGGAMGVVLGAAFMRIYRRTIGFHLEALNIPFIWPPLIDIALVAAGCVLLSILVGVLGAGYPAYSASRLDPYEAIRSGE